MRVVTVVVLVLLAACGNGAGTPPTADTSDGAAAGAAAPGGGITVEEALAGDHDGPVLVVGSYVHRRGEPPRLCSALLESFPPQCGEPALVVNGLEESAITGIEQQDGTIWAVKVQVLGRVADETITVDSTAQY